MHRKRKRAASSENNEFEAQGEGLMADARWVGHIGELFNRNLNTIPEGRVANLEEYTDHLPIRLCLPLQWLNECLSRDYWKDLR